MSPRNNPDIAARISAPVMAIAIIFGLLLGCLLALADTLK